MSGLGTEYCNIDDYEYLDPLYTELRDLGMPSVDSPCMETFLFPASLLNEFMTENGLVERSTVNFKDVNSNWIYNFDRMVSEPFGGESLKEREIPKLVTTHRGVDHVITNIVPLYLDMGWCRDHRESLYMLYRKI